MVVNGWVEARESNQNTALMNKVLIMFSEVNGYLIWSMYNGWLCIDIFCLGRCELVVVICVIIWCSTISYYFSDNVRQKKEKDGIMY